MGSMAQPFLASHTSAHIGELAAPLVRVQHPTKEHKGAILHHTGAQVGSPQQHRRFKTWKGRWLLQRNACGCATRSYKSGEEACVQGIVNTQAHAHTPIPMPTLYSSTHLHAPKHTQTISCAGTHLLKPALQMSERPVHTQHHPPCHYAEARCLGSSWHSASLQALSAPAQASAEQPSNPSTLPMARTSRRRSVS